MYVFILFVGACMRSDAVVDASMLGLRFGVLVRATQQDTVDAFVLVESNYTQTGTPKHLHFWENRYRFQPYWSKIRYVVVWEGARRFLLPLSCPYTHTHTLSLSLFACVRACD
jgi:hypothetical protein